MHADSWIVSWLSTFVSSTSPVLPLFLSSCRLAFSPEGSFTQVEVLENVAPFETTKYKYTLLLGQTLRPFHEHRRAAFLFFLVSGDGRGLGVALPIPLVRVMIRLMPQHQGKTNTIAIPPTQEEIVCVCA